MMKKKDNTTNPFSLDDLFGGDSTFDFGDMDLGDADELLGDFDFDFGNDDPFGENRFIKPKIKVRKESFVTADNALKLAQDIDFHRGDRVDCYVTGNFVFGDFIQAFMDTYKIKARKMTLATLSMNAENIAMLANLLLQEQVDELNLLISSYFYAYERGTGGFIPLIRQTLGQDDRFQVAVASIHTKICTLETAYGEKIVIHGSANLRSSANIEAFTIEDNPDLYDFYDAVHDGLIDKYKTINKEVRGKTLNKALLELGKEYNND